MEIRFSKGFIKQYKKQKKLQDIVDERIELFAGEPFNRLLSNHALRGKFSGYRSINITGDYRAIYKETRPDTAMFFVLGSHSDLYE